jgi:hypothetical protein
VTGGATLEPHFQARLQAKAERFRVLGASTAASRQRQRRADAGPRPGPLDGGHVDEGFFDASQKDAPSLDDDVTIRQAEVPEKAVAPKPHLPRPSLAPGAQRGHRPGRPAALSRLGRGHRLCAATCG